MHARAPSLGGLLQLVARRAASVRSDRPPFSHLPDEAIESAGRSLGPRPGEPTSSLSALTFIRKRQRTRWSAISGVQQRLQRSSLAQPVGSIPAQKSASPLL